MLVGQLLVSCGFVVVALDAFENVAKGSLPFYGTAIGRAVLALVLVSRIRYPPVHDRDRCPSFQAPAWIIGRGRVTRAGHFAVKGPVQVRW